MILITLRPKEAGVTAKHIVFNTSTDKNLYRTKEMNKNVSRFGSSCFYHHSFHCKTDVCHIGQRRRWQKQEVIKFVRERLWVPRDLFQMFVFFAKAVICDFKKIYIFFSIMTSCTNRNVKCTFIVNPAELNVTSPHATFNTHPNSFCS